MAPTFFFIYMQIVLLLLVSILFCGPHTFLILVGGNGGWEEIKIASARLMNKPKTSL